MKKMVEKKNLLILSLVSLILLNGFFVSAVNCTIDSDCDHLVSVGVFENMCCDGVCVNIYTSTNNCGACGNECDEGEYCIPYGSCVDNIYPPGYSPDLYANTCYNMSLKPCNGICVDLYTDEENCGDCGVVCGEGEECVNGACMCGNDYCDSDEKCCNGICVDLLNDKSNCGDCGVVCGEGETCVDGECVKTCDTPIDCGSNHVNCESDICICENNWANCDNNWANGCEIYLSFETNNCEECGNVCYEGEECVNGACMCGNDYCDSDEKCCNGTCLDILYNNSNCGSCGNECDSNQKCCKGQCFDLLNDEENCGACGNECDDGETCINSTCMCGENYCDSDETCCDGTCLNIKNDEDNCGRCGNECDSNEECYRGICINILSDENHCGQINYVCEEGKVCKKGVCEDENKIISYIKKNLVNDEKNNQTIYIRESNFQRFLDDVKSTLLIDEESGEINYWKVLLILLSIGAIVVIFSIIIIRSSKKNIKSDKTQK